MNDYSYIKKNYDDLCAEIRGYEERFGRHITLVAVTKSGTDDELLALCGYGAAEIGENRPGELKRRGELLRAAGHDVILHEIGNLQRNKVKYIIDNVALIHSLDSTALAEEIERRCAAINRYVPVLIEINSGREENKGGILPEDAREFAASLAAYPHLIVKGLMTMGPVCENPEDSRPYFKLTRALYDELRADGLLPEDGILSMGMSDSYRVAIEEGSTLVRVGRKLFRKQE